MRPIFVKLVQNGSVWPKVVPDGSLTAELLYSIDILFELWQMWCEVSALLLSRAMMIYVKEGKLQNIDGDLELDTNIVC